MIKRLVFQKYIKIINIYVSTSEYQNIKGEINSNGIKAGDNEATRSVHNILSNSNRMYSLLKCMWNIF